MFNCVYSLVSEAPKNVEETVWVDEKCVRPPAREETEKEIKVLIKKSGLKEAEVPRRLIIIGLRNVKELADLLKI